MNENTPKPSGQPDLPPLREAVTENLRGVIVSIDVACVLTRRPSRGPMYTQLRPDAPPAPPPDKDKQG